MSEIVNILASALGYAVLVIAVIIGTIYIVNLLQDWKARKEYDRWERSFHKELRKLDNYCSADYPIIKDIVDYLNVRAYTQRSDAMEVNAPTINEFRDQLRKKYPKVQK